MTRRGLRRHGRQADQARRRRPDDPLHPLEGGHCRCSARSPPRPAATPTLVAAVDRGEHRAARVRAVGGRRAAARRPATCCARGSPRCCGASPGRRSRATWRWSTSPARRVVAATGRWLGDARVIDRRSGIDGGPLPQPALAPALRRAPAGRRRGPAPGRGAACRPARDTVALGPLDPALARSPRPSTPGRRPWCWPAATPASSASCGAARGRARRCGCCRRCPAWPPRSPAPGCPGTTPSWSPPTAATRGPAVNACRALPDGRGAHRARRRPGRARRRRWPAGPPPAGRASGSARRDERVTELHRRARPPRGDWADPNVVLVPADPAAAARAGPRGWRSAGAPRRPAGWALPEDAFAHRDSMITKAEVRALVAGPARPAARRPGLGRRRGQRLGRRRVRRFGAAVHRRRARPDDAERDRGQRRRARRATSGSSPAPRPAALAGLPDPDAVFVGGGGRRRRSRAVRRPPARRVVRRPGRAGAGRPGRGAAARRRLHGRGQCSSPPPGSPTCPAGRTGSPPPTRSSSSPGSARDRADPPPDRPGRGHRRRPPAADAWPPPGRTPGSSRRAVADAAARPPGPSATRSWRSWPPARGPAARAAARRQARPTRRWSCVDEARRLRRRAARRARRRANALAERVADVLGARPVVTTATDAAGLPGLDTLGWPVEGAVAAVSRAMLDGEPVRLAPTPVWPLPALPPNVGRPTRPATAYRCWSPTGSVPADERTAVLRPPSLVLGVGASRGVPADEVAALRRPGARRRRAAAGSRCAAVATVDVKADEAGHRRGRRRARLAAA